MKQSCLKCAKHQQLLGYRTCRDCYDIIWGILVQNFSAELGLTDEQTERLAKLSEEAKCIIMGAEETGLDLAEYAEYVVGKADECKARLEEG